MSQAKVDKYKKDKKNRAKINRKEKRERVVASVAGGLVLAAVVVWCGFSVYNTLRASEPIQYTDVNLDAMQDYLSTLS
mgnify:CR=1 FL=1